MAAALSTVGGVLVSAIVMKYRRRYLIETFVGTDGIARRTYGESHDTGRQ